MYLTECYALLKSLSLNKYNNFYMSAEEIYVEIIHFLLFQNENCVALTKKFYSDFI